MLNFETEQRALTLGLWMKQAGVNMREKVIRLIT